MYFAVIGDILSNFCGVKTILDQLDAEGIRRVYHTGNLYAAGQDPGPCIALLQEREVLCVRGHHDKNSVKAVRRARAGTTPGLDSAAIEYLNGLPRRRLWTEEGLRILLCHGAVTSGKLILDRTTARAVFQRQREIEPVDIVISGGAAEPFSCFVDDTLFVMPGVMTAPDGGVRYTLVDTEVLPPSTRTVTL